MYLASTGPVSLQYPFPWCGACNLGRYQACLSGHSYPDPLLVLYICMICSIESPRTSACKASRQANAAWRWFISTSVVLQTPLRLCKLPIITRWSAVGFRQLPIMTAASSARMKRANKICPDHWVQWRAVPDRLRLLPDLAVSFCWPRNFSNIKYPHSCFVRYSILPSTSNCCSRHSAFQDASRDRTTTTDIINNLNGCVLTWAATALFAHF